jgi:glycosyltransferase involved in cell wall biosynthesis
MTTFPLVTVVCPAYNCDRFIEPALESVLSQSYRPIEIIVVDDGSTDSTPEVVQSFREVRYIRQSNQGPSAARNVGIVSALGEYIAFLDLDDLWTPEKLNIQLTGLLAYPKAGLSFGDMRLFWTNDSEELTMFQKYRLTTEYFGHENVVNNAVAKLIRCNFIPTSSVVARKSALTKAGNFDEQFRKAEDWDMWLRIAMRQPIIYSTKLLTLKRLHDVNVSRDSEGMNVASVQVLEKLKQNHRKELQRLGIDISKVLSDCYRNLGYFYLRQKALAKARKALGQSLFLGFHLRSVAYYLSTFAGRRLVGTLVRVRG